MTHKERFHATIERRPVDRPASWLGLPDKNAVPGLLKHFKVSTLDELDRIRGTAMSLVAVTIWIGNFSLTLFLPETKGKSLEQIEKQLLG